MPRTPTPKTSDLTFVSRKPEGGFNYWDVAPAGDKETDYLAGQRLGDEFLSFIGRFPTYGNSTLLACIINDMMAAREGKAIRYGNRLSGLESGFLRQVTGYAMATARLVEHNRDQNTAA